LRQIKKGAPAIAFDPRLILRKSTGPRRAHHGSSPSKEPSMFKRILVPVDGSPTSTKALVAALQLARESGGRVRLLHQFDEMSYLTGYEYSVDVIQQCRGYAEKVLLDAQEIAKASGVPTDTRLADAPGQRLGELVAEEARRFEADLVVVGTHGRRGIGRVLLGSGAEQVLRLAPVPVLAIRAEEPAKAH
jgi:nucleotide-binding universal stress UspA family protein